MSRPVPTVLGEVSAGDLGVVLAHEHLFVRTLDSERQWGGWDEPAMVAKAVDDLGEVVAKGIRTVFDPTVDGLGRDVNLVRRVNERLPDFNVVVATGVYTWGDEPFYWRYRSGAEMTAAFVRDIVDGIRGSGGVRAGFIKCAVDEPGLVRGVSRVLDAAIRAHLETGSPLMVHTHPGTGNGRAVAERLEAAGVRPSAVLLAHSGDSENPLYLSELAGHGYFLGMDRLGPGEPLESRRLEVVAEMCRRGYAASMMLSHDSACHIDWVDPRFMPAGNRYLFLDEFGLPRLRAMGVSEDQIVAMRVESPARWISASA